MIIGFDADDTLWHNEDGFQASQREFESLLAEWANAPEIEDQLFEIEMRNMPRYGYGVKAHTLSMIETAISVSEGQASAALMAEILDLGHALLDRPVELLDGVVEVLDELADLTLMLITKGDLYHQLSRIDSSGLKDRFWQTEIVAHKDVPTYKRVLGLHGIEPEHFVMVGNSLPSDVLPVIELSGRGVHVPYHVTWSHEQHEGHHEAPVIQSLTDLPSLLSDWEIH
jgi:putative hydrolase of the HAD superfamily